MFESANSVLSAQSSPQSIYEQYDVPDLTKSTIFRDKFGSNGLTNVLDRFNSDLLSANPNTTSVMNSMLASKIDSANAREQYERQLALQKDQQAANAYEARIAREWSERMSNTANQRAVADLKAAGLNPWLAIANPASSAGGVAASSGQGQVSRAENTSTSALNTGVTAMAQIVSHVIDAIAKMASSAASAAAAG